MASSERIAALFGAALFCQFWFNLSWRKHVPTADSKSERETMFKASGVVEKRRRMVWVRAQGGGLRNGVRPKSAASYYHL
mgnify:CR=1 FL=1